MITEQLILNPAENKDLAFHTTIWMPDECPPPMYTR